MWGVVDALPGGIPGSESSSLRNRRRCCANDWPDGQTDSLCRSETYSKCVTDRCTEWQPRCPRRDHLVDTITHTRKRRKVTPSDRNACEVPTLSRGDATRDVPSEVGACVESCPHAQTRGDRGSASIPEGTRNATAPLSEPTKPPSSRVRPKQPIIIPTGKSGNGGRSLITSPPLQSVALVVLLAFSVLPLSAACPKPCVCTPPAAHDGKGDYSNVEEGIRISCVGAGFSSVPSLQERDDIEGDHVTSLDLSNNNLTTIQNLAFASYPALRHLKLSGNRITTISKESFHGLRLHTLLLDNNHLSGLLTGSLPDTLHELSLEDNFFSNVPPSVSLLHSLQVLNLARNKISTLRGSDFNGLHNLLSLSLHQNDIATVDPASFAPLTQLQILDLTGNNLVEIPKAILQCSTLKRILLEENQLTYVGEESLKGLTELQQVALQGNPLLTVHHLAFADLPSLTKLILKETRKLKNFPSLNGTYNLEQLRIDRADLTTVPPDLCSYTPKLRSLNLHLNNIKEMPKLSDCSRLRLLDMSDNAISSLGHESFIGAPNLQDLLLHDNQITHIPADAFTGLGQLQVLALQHNKISQIDEDAFLPLVSIEDINLGDNVFPELPHRGLEKVVSIKVHNNPYLKEFPGPESFPKVHTLTLSYAYHCCPFLNIEEKTTEEKEEVSISEDVLFDVSEFQGMHDLLWNNSRIWSEVPEQAFSNQTSATSYDLPEPEGSAGYPIAGSSSGRFRPQCIPLPGPFMPCRDLFDWWTLRCGVWIVFLLALMGNGVVVVVLVAAYAKMDVPRFLVTNLAIADFFMGVYLGFLAVVDASTLGEFRMYAIPWQMSPACQVAGFLGVLSSELSVYTLAVITLERNYAITHAMHLQKRLSLRQAAYIMAIGWVFALTMAVLPLAGISDYRKFAVCLPFETDGGGLGYIVFLMFVNGMAFLILMGCYFKIYCAIRGSQAWNSNDSRIAKRMALLVFTDFICWAPIAFFSLTAAFDIQLISLEEAKVFTVFILPLNSCCNPFLYALLTKQFKKDCVMLCKTIEESRVTRGIGRCRHSSNFSNRQTPANTNSAIDQSSGTDRQSCVCKGKMEKKKRRLRLDFTSLKYMLCTKGAEEITSSSDTSYQTDRTLQRGPRHASLSSDTYSGSWSDTWRRGRGPTTLRLMDRRRHNSWAASNKPSQESSLSNSRPDSTATSTSTATWRISRSSVSSDTSNGGSGRYKTSEQTPQTRVGSIRERRGDRRMITLNRQPSQTQLTKEQPYTRPPTVRPKPRLQRQSAVEREVYMPSKEMNGGDTPACPLHIRPDHLSCVYEQESHEEDTQIPGTSHTVILKPALILSPTVLGAPDDGVFLDSSEEPNEYPDPSPSHIRAASSSPRATSPSHILHISASPVRPPTSLSASSPCKSPVTGSPREVHAHICPMASPVLSSPRKPEATSLVVNEEGEIISETTALMSSSPSQSDAQKPSDPDRRFWRRISQSRSPFMRLVHSSEHRPESKFHPNEIISESNAPLYLLYISLSFIDQSKTHFEVI
ncbi:leucine-rich repeat-containing G-protein coupled receptor 5-like isoform X2 [Macrobrachium nipponense]|uniref:leucine-rich repeat-containing G-protein coupled receptor 5-like isoform X2 n=1 Tax=Macrobrachium nipponense TaxID=159736 RepID=UPI0030C8AC39